MAYGMLYDLRQHFLEMSKDSFWVKSSLGVSALKALDFKVKKYLGEFHQIAVLSDPKYKDSLQKILNLSQAQLRDVIFKHFSVGY